MESHQKQCSHRTTTNLRHFVDIRTTLHEQSHDADVPTKGGSMKSRKAILHNISNHSIHTVTRCSTERQVIHRHANTHVVHRIDRYILVQQILHCFQLGLLSTQVQRRLTILSIAQRHVRSLSLQHRLTPPKDMQPEDNNEPSSLRGHPDHAPRAKT
jgi:hypothetical protein